MKVLLVSPRGGLSGGIAKWTEHIINYYQGIRTSNIHITEVCNNQSTAVFGSDRKITRIRAGISNYYPLIRKFNRVTKADKYDVVHICTSASFSLIKDLLISKIARGRGLRTVIHCHFGRIPVILSNNNWEKRLLVKTFELVDEIIVMDLHSLNALKDYGYKNVSYLPNPLSLSVQELITLSGKKERKKGMILYVGHIVKNKGVYELVSVCKQINNISLVLMGPIPSEDIKGDLISLAGESWQEWLTFSGTQPPEKVIEGMLSCNVFTLPSYSEGFPNVIIESMACGCPIVATNVGAIPEMLNITSKIPCGVCVVPRDINSLREAIIRVLSDDNAYRMGEMARQRVNNVYSISVVWEQLINIWKGR